MKPHRTHAPWRGHLGPKTTTGFAVPQVDPIWEYDGLSVPDGFVEWMMYIARCLRERKAHLRRTRPDLEEWEINKRALSNYRQHWSN